jgi:hypothetical protein
VKRGGVKISRTIEIKVKFCLLGHNTVYSVKIQVMFLRKLILLANCFTLVSYLAYSSNPKMEATCSFETSSNFQPITLRYIPED